MIYIDDTGVVNLTVGDDASLNVSLKDDDGKDYEMSDAEYLIFSVREKPTADSELILEIQSEPGSNEIRFAHDDTSELAPGFYSAEIQLMLRNGDRTTVWPKLTGSSRTSTGNRKNFCLMTEVVRR